MLYMHVLSGNEIEFHQGNAWIGFKYSVFYEENSSILALLSAKTKLSVEIIARLLKKCDLQMHMQY